MTAPEVAVLDASVGVKWFRPEPGRQDALRILEAARVGEYRVAAPVHFVHEVLSIVGRTFESRDIVAAWELLDSSGIDIVPLTDEVVREAAVQCSILGCDFYDALAPAVASLLGATLVSADRRAHAAFPGVRLIG